MKYLFVPLTITSFLSIILGLFWPMREYYDIIIKIGFAILCLLGVIGFITLYKTEGKNKNASQKDDSNKTHEVVYMGFCERNATKADEIRQAKIHHSLTEKVWID